MGINAHKRHQHVIGVCCCFIFIHIGGNTALNLEKVVGVAVYLVCGRGSKPHHQRVEVLKNGAVFLEDGTVRFVDNNQVEMCRRVHAHIVVITHRIYSIQNGGIRGKHDACIAIVFVRA